MVASRAHHADRAGEAIAPGMVAGHPHRARVDIAGDDLAVQPLRRRDRQDAAAGADSERTAEAAAPRQIIQRQQTTAGRGMLAGAESGRRVDLDRERAGWRRPAPMRAVHKKPPDTERRKGATVFQEPIALGQSFLDDMLELSAGARRSERQPDFE